MRKPNSVTTETLTKNVNSVYRFFGGRKLSPTGQLQVLQRTIPIVGRILHLYGICPDILRDYQETLLPKYRTISNVADVEKCFDATYVIIRRIRNKLHEA